MNREANSSKSLKKSIYFDMDNVLADFAAGIKQLDPETLKEYEGRLDEIPGFFAVFPPVTGAIEAVNRLSQVYECHILSTAPWLNASAWTDKVEWIQKYFGKGEESPFYKRIVLTHDKAIYKGDYLIDDRNKHGVLEFSGEWIHFGSDEFPNWDTVCEYLLKRGI